MVRCQGTIRVLAFLIVVSASLLASPAGQAQPDGSRSASAPRGEQASDPSERWIRAEAERLSGRTLTFGCATTPLEWAQSLAGAGLRAGASVEYYGFSLIDRGELQLSPYVCEGLRLGASASTRRRNELQVAWSVNVLIHESIHIARFSADEAMTEACARRQLPAELHRLYGLAYGSAEIARLTLAATWFRRTQGAAYQGGTCA